MNHTWVLIHPVKNFTISTQIILAFLYLQDINFNPDYREEIQMQKLHTFPKKSTRQKWTGPIYLPAHIYNLMSQ